MRVCAILNRGGGTLRTTDLDAYEKHLRDAFTEAGHDLEINVVDGKDLIKALKKAADNPDSEVILAGGGDGTISAAADIIAHSDKALAVIPAGTMNLFARSLGIPLDIWEAAPLLANGKMREGDIASANGRHFIHQFSVGMQPRMVRERERAHYNSRFGKILASTRATFNMMFNPPFFRAEIQADGDELATGEFSMIAVSTNPYGKGHIPFADTVDAGVLGVYHTPHLDHTSSMKLVADLMVGGWEANESFSANEARKVHLSFPKKKKSAQAVIDGELIKLAPEVTIEIHPGALKVIVPQQE